MHCGIENNLNATASLSEAHCEPEKSVLASKTCLEPENLERASASIRPCARSDMQDSISAHRCPPDTSNQKALLPRSVHRPILSSRMLGGTMGQSLCKPHADKRGCLPSWCSTALPHFDTMR